MRSGRRRQLCWVDASGPYRANASSLPREDPNSDSQEAECQCHLNHHRQPSLIRHGGDIPKANGRQKW